MHYLKHTSQLTQKVLTTLQDPRTVHRSTVLVNIATRAWKVKHSSIIGNTLP